MKIVKNEFHLRREADRGIIKVGSNDLIPWRDFEPLAQSG
jgi:hypothetical protein